MEVEAPKPPGSFLDPALAEALDGARATLPKPDDLKSWRSRCYVLALRFAQHFGLESLIHSGSSGHGFFVEIPPEKVLQKSDLKVLDMKDLGTRIALDESCRCAWWMLFSLSEMSATDDRLALAPDHLQLPKLLRAEDGFEVLNRRVSPATEMPMLPYVLLTSHHIKDPAFRDLLLLIDACRAIKKSFREDQLWHCITIEQYRMKLSFIKVGGLRHGG